MGTHIMATGRHKRFFAQADVTMRLHDFPEDQHPRPPDACGGTGGSNKMRFFKMLPGDAGYEIYTLFFGSVPGLIAAVLAGEGTGRGWRFGASRKPMPVAMNTDQSGYCRIAAESSRPPAELAALRITISPAAATCATARTTSGDDDRCTQLARSVLTA
jgi:hypothetical protein